MYIKIRNAFWGFSILSCFPLYSWGQIFLFISKQKEAEFYNLINKYPGDWINAHLLLMAGLVLLLPAFNALCHYFKSNKAYPLVQLSTFFTYIYAFSLFGQFTIDLCLIGIFKSPMDDAYHVTDNIRANPTINTLFYDNSQLFFILKYVDFASLSFILLGIALIISKILPKWAIFLFFTALLLTQFGILIDPFYGRIIKRLSYSLFSFSLLPIAIDMLKNKDAHTIPKEN